MGSEAARAVFGEPMAKVTHETTRMRMVGTEAITD
jgi:hypothetical protein